MSIRDEFNKRWSITDEPPYEEEFRKFKTRILNVFDDIDSHVTDDGITLFCQTLGIVEQWHSSAWGDRQWSSNIIDALKAETKEKDFYFLIELIMRLPMQNKYGLRGTLEWTPRVLVRNLVDAVNLSRVNVALALDDKERVIFHPKGEKELDSKLVQEPFGFLNNSAKEHFVSALKFYQAKTSAAAVKSAESLRRALEEFLRFKLKNSSGLKENIKTLQKTLKGDGRDPKVRAVIFATFTYLDDYFNENSKHKDGDIDPNENEFLIYQTGLLMRYVDQAVR